MKTAVLNSNLLSNHIVRIALVTAALLLVPLVAMQFSEDVDWELNDFVVMGALIFGTGLLLNWVITKVRTTPRRVALGALVVLIFLYIWAELAVGIFTHWGS